MYGWLIAGQIVTPTSKTIQLYTARSRSYLWFVNALAYPRGMRAYFRRSTYLKSGLNVLDAGCGSGIAALELRKAMLSRGLQPGRIKCFDITPKMIAIFRERLRKEAIEGVEVVQADTLHLETIPGNWKDFDLIISAAMMEYIPSEKFVNVLSGLKSRLSDTGSVVLFITRKNWLTKLLIGTWWGANSYKERELETFFRRAGFSTITFTSFPLPYKHLCIWGHIVEAR